jgi:hypothetical protein
MPFAAHIFALLEDALAEAFQYHTGLDNFLRRAGIPDTRISAARTRAEERSKGSPRRFARAPKRFVAQELLAELGTGTDTDDRLLAGLVTSLCRGNFPEATPKAKSALAALVDRRAVERNEAEARRTEQRAKLRDDEREKEAAAARKAAERDKFKDAFLRLSQQQNPQARGYMLEKFLNEFLAFEGLNPRASFRLVGEQIDGSFSWVGRIYLVEARWVTAPVGGAGFSSLMFKIEGKTADTRGLFISINGYSPDAIESLRRKGELRFVCIDGAHLMRALEHGENFPTILETLWRHASETGEAYVPVSSPLFTGRVTRSSAS